MILASLRCSSRHFATASATKRGPKVEPSRLPNGLSVASVELQGPISQLMFAFRSGARFEQHDEAGLTHQLRNAIGTDSTNNGHYTDNLNIAAPGVVTQHVCKASNLNQFQLSQINSLHPDTGVVGVYLSTEGTKVLPFVKAAAQGLREMASKPISDELLQACKLLAKGTALTPDEFIALLKTVTADDVKKAASPTLRQSPHLAGEVHQAGPTDLAHVALVGHGAKLADKKAVAIQAVLCAAIGQTGHYSDNLNIAAPSVVAQHVFKASNLNQFHRSLINLPHPDTGAVGVYLSGVRNYSTSTGFVELKEFVAQVKLNVAEKVNEMTKEQSKVELNVAEKVNEMTKEHLLIIGKAANFANTTLRMLQGAVVIVLVALGGVGIELAVLAYKVDGKIEERLDGVEKRIGMLEKSIGLLLKKAGVKEE